MQTIIAPRYTIAIAARYATTLRSGFPIDGMKTVEEVRRERLALLRKEAGSLVALNEKLGLNSRDATLSQILNAAKNSRTGTPKQMGSKLARELEKACEKEVGWMDTDPALLKGGTFLPDVESVAADINQLPQRQRDWVLRTVRDAIEMARETLQPTSNTLSKPKDSPGDESFAKSSRMMKRMTK
jgi:hypothetical protein